jgi:hypothetical protein
MYLRKTTIVLAALLLVVSSTGLAADMSGKLGFGFNASRSSQAVMVKFWVSESITIEPLISFRHISIEGNSATEMIPGVGFSFYLNSSKDARPFIGFRISADLISANDETNTDFAVSPALGGEYFFNEHFSVSGEFQLNIIFTDSEYSPGVGIADATVIQTTQLLGVNIYF